MAVEKKVATGEDAKKKALNDAIAQIEKQFGKGAIMRLGDSARNNNVQVISTRCLTLDMALGINGLPRGRIVEIYGPESSGKTTLALQVVAECQRVGGTAAFIDTEQAIDKQYAEKLGVDVDNMLLSQADSGEQALEIVEALARSGAVDVIVVDSVAALTPSAEIDGLMGDAHVGLLARLMSQALRKLTSVVNRSNTCLIFTNQLRDKIGGMGYGPNETTTGGKALKFYASIRLDVRKIEQIKDGTEVVGNRTRVKVVKNKMAPPFRVADFDIMYGKGVSQEGCIVDLAVDNNLIEKSGAWFSYNGEKLGQGKENTKAYLKDHPELCTELITKITETIAKDLLEGGKKKKKAKVTDKKGTSADEEDEEDEAEESVDEADEE